MCLLQKNIMIDQELRRTMLRAQSGNDTQLKGHLGDRISLLQLRHMDGPQLGNP